MSTPAIGANAPNASRRAIDSTDSTVARCLAKDPGGRFKSMKEMAEALGGIDRRRLSGRHAGPRGGLGYGFVLGAFIAGALVTAGGMWLGTRAAADDGSIVVTSRPSGAAVEIDGRAWKQTTPTAVTGLGPGTHSVRLRADGHAPVEQSVALDKSGHVALDVDLPAR